VRPWRRDLAGRTSAGTPDLAGRTALVTGANSGIGWEVSAALAACGARVLLACRNPAKAVAAVDRCREQATGPDPEAVDLDLSDLASVRQCAADLPATVERLDLLVNNAGVMALPRLLTVDGFEMQLATNHLGHFALTGLLLPLLRRGDGGRVVTVSSVLAARARSFPLHDPHGALGYDGWAAYHQSKLANLLFAAELERRSRRWRWGVRSLAAHPGLSNTRLMANGAAAWGAPRSGMSRRVAVWCVAQSPRRGAMSIMRAATGEVGPDDAYFGPRGPGHLRGRPGPVRPPRAARDVDLAGRLWTMSEDLTGVVFPTGYGGSGGAGTCP
jgi:NAD(P)-dependent dehydrogenase (short-subunit alcohol dehydrogenase family)